MSSLVKRLKISLSKREGCYNKIFDWILLNCYYPLYDFIYRTKERLSRSWEYAKFGYINYDFDSAYIYNLLSFKLKRIYKALQNDIAIQSKQEMDALKETIKICDRLFDEQYDKKYFKIHDKKWGSLKSKSIPSKAKESLTEYKLYRSKVKSKKDERQQQKELSVIYQQSEQDRFKDIDRLAFLLKYIAPMWWS